MIRVVEFPVDPEATPHNRADARDQAIPVQRGSSGKGQQPAGAMGATKRVPWKNVRFESARRCQGIGYLLLTS